MSVDDLIGKLSNLSLDIPYMINDITYLSNSNNKILYFYCKIRNIWIPFKNINKEFDKTRFFIEDNILSYEQISDLNFYKSIINKLIQYEEWKIDLEFPNYEFSNLGRLKLKNGEISERITNGNGYIIVGLYNKYGIEKHKRLHRMIAKLFILNNNILKIEVNHINGIRHDNRLANLEWVTPSENMNNRQFISDTNSSVRAINQCDKDGKILKEWKSMKEIVDFFGVQGIEHNLDNKKEYKGFYWYRKSETEIDGEVFKDLYIKEIDKTVKISNKGRYVRYNGSISDGTLNKEKYKVCGISGKQFKVHRLVLRTFKPIDNHKDMIVDHIDGNKSNNVLENLRWATISENSQYHYANNTHNINHKTRPVIFTHIESGNEYEFHSVSLACRESGFTDSQIKRGLNPYSVNNILEDKRGKYKIRYKTDIIKFERINKTTIRVNQYGLDDKFIQTFNSLIEAAKFVKAASSCNISQCCRGYCKKAHEFIWKYEDESVLLNTNACEVVQLDMDYNFISFFESGAEAERHTKIFSSNILKTCKREHDSAGNFRWRYKDDYDNIVLNNSNVSDFLLREMIKSCNMKNSSGEL